MTINNPRLFMAGIWDWKILDGCFGQTRIKPSDIDGLIERNGKCLFIETKQPGVRIPYGQLLICNALVEVGFTVLIIWGETNTPCKIKLLAPKGIETYEPADVDTLRAIVTRWYAWADKQPRCWTKTEQKC